MWQIKLLRATHNETELFLIKDLQHKEAEDEKEEEEVPLDANDMVRRRYQDPIE